jgi:hypothetical protein
MRAATTVAPTTTNEDKGNNTDKHKRDIDSKHSITGNSKDDINTKQTREASNNRNTHNIKQRRPACIASIIAATTTVQHQA